jgi:PEP-CTERM motif
MSATFSDAVHSRSKLVLIVVVLVVLLLAPRCALADTVTFVSNATWNVTDSSNTSLGGAQAVCLNSSFPTSCPAGATLYGYGGSGWGANLSSIPGAAWIWAPGVTGSTLDPSFLAFTFSQVFSLGGAPLSGTIAVAADDFASVFVNGNFVGSVGSTTDISLAGAGQSALTSFNILPFLVSGSNTISILGQNGLNSFGGCTTNCTYSLDPAGVVFGGTLTSVTPVPEPSTLLLLGTGLGGLILRKWKATPR